MKKGPIGADIRFTYLGHSAFMLTSPHGKYMLIDPWISDNPMCEMDLGDGDQFFYGGDPTGFVIRFENGVSVYHAGDTDVFTDMEIIGDFYNPQVALLPIGGHYTMGPEGTVYACKLIRPKYVIPMHFSTFPVLTGTPKAFQELMKEVPGTTVILLQPGESAL